MRHSYLVRTVACAALALAASGAPAAPSNAELKQQVADTERAFAATMKARDLAAVTSFLSELNSSLDLGV